MPTFNTTSASPVSGMTAAVARQYLLMNVRNGQDSSMYSTTNQDLAIMAIGNRLIEQAHLSRSSDLVEIAADDEEVNFSDIAGFLPEFIIDDGIRIVESTDYPDSDDLESLRVVSPSEIAHEKTISTSSGVPCLIAFVTAANIVSSCIVWPKPRADGMLSVTWQTPFTSYTAGTGSPGAIALNLRGSLLIEALIRGGPAYLQSNEPDNATAAANSETKLSQWIDSCRGKGGSGVKSIQRESVSDRRCGRRR